MFFGAGQYGLAFAEIVLMWLAIGLTVVLFAPVSRVAAALMLPYWAWVTFAAAAEPVDLAAEQLTGRSPAAAPAGDRRVRQGQQRGTPGMYPSEPV